MRFSKLGVVVVAGAQAVVGLDMSGTRVLVSRMDDLQYVYFPASLNLLNFRTNHFHMRY